MNEIIIVELGFLTSIYSKSLLAIAPLFSKKTGDYLVYGGTDSVGQLPYSPHLSNSITGLIFWGCSVFAEVDQFQIGVL